MYTIIELITLAVGCLCTYGFFCANIPEGSVGVVSRFGRITETLNPGFNFKFPWDYVNTLSVQNQAIEIDFIAITIDQISVYFNCTILFSVIGNHKSMIKRAAYSFASESEFEICLQRIVKNETRAYVTTKRKVELIWLPQDFIDEVTHMLMPLLRHGVIKW